MTLQNITTIIYDQVCMYFHPSYIRNVVAQQIAWDVAIFHAIGIVYSRLEYVLPIELEQLCDEHNKKCTLEQEKTFELGKGTLERSVCNPSRQQRRKIYSFFVNIIMIMQKQNKCISLCMCFFSFCFVSVWFVFAFSWGARIVFEIEAEQADQFITIMIRNV